VKAPRLLRGPLGDDLRAALPGWLVARAAIALGAMLAVVAVDELAPGDRPLQLDQGFFAWDAAWYRDIADHGYDGVDQAGLRFFPLLPMLARALSFPLLGNVGVALVIVVNVAALAAGVVVHRLVREEKGDRALASRSTWLLGLLPPAVVLVLGYAEAIAIALAAGVFLALRRKRWWWAAALGVLAGLCRPTGVLLALPALVEALRGWPGARDRIGRIAAVVSAPAGAAGFLAWVEWKYEDWTLPLRLQNTPDLRGGWADPFSAAWSSVRHLVSGDELGEGLHAPWIALFLVLLVVVFARWPFSYGVFAFSVLAMALSAESLGSIERYGLFAFPLVLALATITGEPRVERAVLTFSGAALTGFTALVFVGAFVP